MHPDHRIATGTFLFNLAMWLGGLWRDVSQTTLSSEACGAITIQLEPAMTGDSLIYPSESQ